MKRIKILLISVVVVLCMAMLVGCSFTSGEVKLPSTTPYSASVEIASNSNTDYSKNDLTVALEKTDRTAVAIAVESGSKTFYGSGTIIDINKKDANGDIIREPNVYYIVTCHHVISGAGDITVYVPDAECRNYTDSGYDASYAFRGNISSQKTNDGVLALVGSDPVTDIAVLKIATSKTLQKAKIPNLNTYKLKKGQPIYSIGNPTGLLPGTVSTGIISYLNRTVKTASVGYMKLMQIDVETTHGNSGGGLYNYSGELIGITNAGNDDHASLNYAIPLTIDHNGLDKGFVNVVTQLVGSETTNNYGFVAERWSLGAVIEEDAMVVGITVDSVEEGGNADLAGLKVGDKISSVEYNGKTVTTSSVEAFDNCLREMKTLLVQGNTFTLNIKRGYSSRAITVTISQLGDVYLDTTK